MAATLSTLSFLLLHAASISPAAVVAQGKQEATLTLDQPGAYQLSARGPSGTACELVDRVRGPFARAGAVGVKNCELALLLDAGQYKVRLESPSKGKGEVALAITPFTELNPQPLRLVKGSGVTTTLKPGQQATYLLKVEKQDERQAPFIRVAGRHAGQVRLWRNAAWLEPISFRHITPAPTPGQPLHEWWLETPVEAGEYQLVVYGRDSTVITGDSTDDTLTVEAGFPVLSGPSARFTIPSSGVVVMELPPQRLWALMSLDVPPVAPASLELYSPSRSGPLGGANTCRLDKGAVLPECTAEGGGADAAPVAMIRGPVGASGVLEWAPRVDAEVTSSGRGGYWGSSTRHLPFRTTTGGKHLVAIHELPVDVDGPPQACLLERVSSEGEPRGVVARSLPQLADDEVLEREFNYSDSAVVWFEVGGSGSARGLLEKAGLSSRRYHISTSGGRKSACEVYRIEASGSLKRLTESTPDGKECQVTLQLSPGAYAVQLSGGLSGVEKLTIAQQGVSKPKRVAPFGGCLIPEVALEPGDYRVTLAQTGRSQVRGLQVIPLPIPVGASLHLHLDAKREVALPLAPGAPRVVSAVGGASFSCTGAPGAVAHRPGACEVAHSAATTVLTLGNASDGLMTLSVQQPSSPPEPQSLVRHTPRYEPLPQLKAGARAYFDFDRAQSRSAAFEVTRPGLYSVTTEGLLATRCQLRTPVIDSVATDSASGRGRNCLIQTWLQPGRYLLTATTEGESRGRAALVLTQRPATKVSALTAAAEAFFRVDAHELVQQQVTVPAAGRYLLETTTPATGGLQCRLDDANGWPLETVPTRCSLQRELAKGSYLWTQLPLTVESMRHSTLSPVRPPVVLKGNKPHRVNAFTWYDLELGADGKDELRFELVGPSTLDLVLTHGMQGRIERLEANQPPKPVEVIPAQESSAARDEGEADASEDSSEYEEGAAEEGEFDEPPRALPVKAPALPSGVKVSLPAGSYRIITQHSRGDVGIRYRFHFGSEVLVPGMRRSVPVPSTVPVSIPQDGVLKLHTAGETDVRCRLLDEGGAVVLDGRDHGADWNCALFEPVAKGRYTLVLESETQRAGTTTVSLEVPASEDLGVLTDGVPLVMKTPVVTLALPNGEADVVYEVSISGGGEVSCALEDASGRMFARSLGAKECRFLVRPQRQSFRLRVWGASAKAKWVAGVKTKRIVPGVRGKMAPHQALQVSLSRAGRYRTGPKVMCAGVQEVGPLHRCGPEVSLEAGEVIFAASGAEAAELSLEEVRVAASPAAMTVPLYRHPFIQAVTASSPSLILLTAEVAHGEKVGPACGIQGGIAAQGDASCAAIGRVGTEAISRVWVAIPYGSSEAIEAQVVRRAVSLPKEQTQLSPGRQRLTVPASGGRWAVPAPRVRLSLTLPADGFSALLTSAGAVQSFCAPQPRLHHCELTGEGGSLVVFAPHAQAEVTLVMLEKPLQRVALSGLYEEAPSAPGTIRLEVAAANEPRWVKVVGASGCTLTLSNGTRRMGCQAQVPAQQSAELEVEHGVEPLRALLHAEGRAAWVELGLPRPASPGPSLAAARAVPVSGSRMDRTLVLEKEGVVRVLAEVGVCGLMRGEELLTVDGLSRGCELVRVLPAGTYQLLWRPFAGRARGGTLHWTAETVSPLSEGVGPEEWAGPGEVRLYRFEVSSAGKVGLGVQAQSEQLGCEIYNERQELLGEGCHQYLSLSQGRYLLMVRNPKTKDPTPRSFRPVLFGLTGAKQGVPESYLQDFFRRMGMNRE